MLAARHVAPPFHAPRTAVPGLARMLRGLLWRGTAFAVLLAAWAVVSHFRWVTPFLLPSPGQVVRTGIELLADGSLLRNAWISMARALAGFALSAIIALPLGVLFTVAPTVRRLLEPPIEFMRQIPPLALIPLLVLWLGIGEAQKLGVVALTCFFPVFLGTLDGLARVDPKLVEVGQVCAMPRAAIVRRIVLPAAAPTIVTGLRISLGFSWRALVGAELIAASAGLGFLIIDAQNLARTDIVLVGVVVIGVLGMLADRAALAAVRRLMPWMPGAEGAQGA